jgi:hypothetical protein
VLKELSLVNVSGLGDELDVSPSQSMSSIKSLSLFMSQDDVLFDIAGWSTKNIVLMRIANVKTGGVDFHGKIVQRAGTGIGKVCSWMQQTIMLQRCLTHMYHIISLLFAKGASQ